MQLPENILDSDFRYSSKPIGEYAKKSNNELHGTATSTLLDSVPAWNLAYISFDVESTPQHHDPYFTTHIRRSLQTKLTDGSQDLLQAAPFSEFVGSLLFLPAPRFVHIVKSHKVLKSLPLYKAYGQSWLETIEKRSWLCGYDRGWEAEVCDVSLALRFLQKY